VRPEDEPAGESDETGDADAETQTVNRH
jgi:hypothetical protein